MILPVSYWRIRCYSCGWFRRAPAGFGCCRCNPFVSMIGICSESVGFSYGVFRLGILRQASLCFPVGSGRKRAGTGWNYAGSSRIPSRSERIRGPDSSSWVFLSWDNNNHCFYHLIKLFSFSAQYVTKIISILFTKWNIVSPENS